MMQLKGVESQMHTPTSYSLPVSNHSIALHQEIEAAINTLFNLGLKTACYFYSFGVLSMISRTMKDVYLSLSSCSLSLSPYTYIHTYLYIYTYIYILTLLGECVKKMLIKFTRIQDPYRAISYHVKL